MQCIRALVYLKVFCIYLRTAAGIFSWKWGISEFKHPDPSGQGV